MVLFYHFFPLFATALCGVALTFSQIEEIIEAKLPPSARNYDAWWGNHPSHPLAEQWLAAGYLAKSHDRTAETLTLSKSEKQSIGRTSIKETRQVSKKFAEKQVTNTSVSDKSAYSLCLHIAGHTFEYLQELSPERNLDGTVKEFRPQDSYNNVQNLPLLKYGTGSFCRFSLDAGSWRGVYIWVSSGEIIYIGETENLAQRFNSGYGYIAARNCYAGGQSTNCRMNKVVLDYYKRGHSIQLYFLKTDFNKEIESELLRLINTRFNIKDN